MTFCYKTLYKQLGGAKFKAMVRAKNLMYTQQEKFLRFDFGSGVITNNGVNFCRIDYKKDDTYEMTFYKKRVKNHMPEFTEVHKIPNVYADKLQYFFTMATGLETHL